MNNYFVKVINYIKQLLDQKEQSVTVINYSNWKIS